MSESIKRRNRLKSISVRRAFKIGDWVFGIGENQGCSQVFEGDNYDYQPFSYLDDYDPNNYRLATDDEKRLADNSEDGR